MRSAKLGARQKPRNIHTSISPTLLLRNIKIYLSLINGTRQGSLLIASIVIFCPYFSGEERVKIMELKPPDLDPVTGVMQVKDVITDEVTEYLGIGPCMADRKEYLFFFAASILVSVGILFLMAYIYLWPLVKSYYFFVSDKEKIGAIVKVTGDWGPIVFILLVAAEVIIIFLPVPLEIAGGYLFGLPLGTFYSMIGLSLGMALSFLVGRWLERIYFRKRINPKKLQRFQQFMKRQGTLAAFIIYLIPGVPKDFIGFILGATPLSLQFFVPVGALFRLPVTFLLNLQGAEVAKGNYWLSLGLIGFNYFLAVLVFRYREYLYQWIKAWHLEEL
jgi:uncharacterized membrane protein YdjX (TVP38/TMEM64 family)